MATSAPTPQLGATVPSERASQAFAAFNHKPLTKVHSHLSPVLTNVFSALCLRPWSRGHFVDTKSFKLTATIMDAVFSVPYPLARF